MTPETPKETVEASQERFERLEGLVRRASRVEGRVTAVETQTGNVSPSLDGMDDLEMTREALVSRIEDLQVERRSVAEALDEDGGIAGFEPTETAFFG